MLHRIPLVCLITVSLATARAFADSPRFAGGDVLAYYDGQLVSVSLKLMPPSSWDALRRQEEKLGEFYDGFTCFCNFGPDSVGVCACFSETPVLRSLDEGPLYRAFSVYGSYTGPPGGSGYTSFAQLDADIRDGQVGVIRELGVYRLIVRRKKTGSEPANMIESFASESTPEQSSTWGSVKALFK